MRDSDLHREFDEIKAAIAEIKSLLVSQGEKEMSQIDDLLTSVGSLTTVVDSAEALLGQLHQMLQDALASGDPAKIQQAIDAIEQNKAELAAAVAANTPGA